MTDSAPDLSRARCPKCLGINITSVGFKGLKHCRLFCDDCYEVTGGRPVWTWPEWLRVGPSVWDAVEFNLRDALSGAWFENLVVTRATPRSEGTKRIADTIAERAAWDGLEIEREVRVTLPTSMENVSGEGRFDLILRIPGHDRGLVVEIDADPKLWSIDKLHYARAELGHEALWVRWHDHRKRYVPPSIRLIDLCDTEDKLRAEYELVMAEEVKE